MTTETFSENEQIILETINTVLAQEHLPALRRKRTRTHGGEWEGPCPRCHRLQTGGKNEDRFIVWPARPADGHGSREEPVFMCRQCRRVDDPSRPWTGDLIQFVRDMYGMSYQQARHFLHQRLTGNSSSCPPLPRAESSHSLSTTGAPAHAWQVAATALVQDAYQTLWSQAGASARVYLMQERGLTEETLHTHRLGYLPCSQFVDGASFGREGRLFLPRGIVLPEFHKLVVDGIAQYEMWSVSIRRPAKDLLYEEKRTGKRAAKYHTLAGSVKGLYLADCIQSSLPILLVEGYFDALSGWQEVRDLVNVVATLSATGARQSIWLHHFVQAPFVLLGFDHDTAGEQALAYWRTVLPPHKRMSWLNQHGDLNAMLQRGDDLRAFIEQGCQVFHRVHPVVSLPPPSQDGPETGPEAQNMPLVNGGASLPFPQEQKPSERLPGPVYEVSSEASPLPYRDSIGVCPCGQAAFYSDGHGSQWCAAHVWVALLCEYGGAIGWPACSFPGGMGLVNVRESRRILVEGGSLAEGYAAYAHTGLRLCETEEGRARLWMALSFVRGLARKRCPPSMVHKTEDALPPSSPASVTVPCSRAQGGCSFDASQPLIEERHAPSEGGKRSVSRLVVMGKSHTIADTFLQWCPRCRACFFILEMGRRLGFPAVHTGGSADRDLPAGADAWITVCQTSSPLVINWIFDAVRVKYPALWQDVSSLI
jgi:hypothetical protein